MKNVGKSARIIHPHTKILQSLVRFVCFVSYIEVFYIIIRVIILAVIPGTLLHLFLFKLLSSIVLKFNTLSSVLPEVRCALCGLCLNDRSLCSSVLRLLSVCLRTHISIYTTKSPENKHKYHLLLLCRITNFFLCPLKSSHKTLKADKLRKSQLLLLPLSVI